MRTPYIDIGICWAVPVVSVNSVIHTHSYVSRPGGYEMIVAGQSHGRIER